MKKITIVLAILVGLANQSYAQITYVYDYNNQVVIEQVPNQFMAKFSLNEDMIPVITPNDSFILKRVHNGGFVLKGNSNQLFELFHEYLNSIQPVYTFNVDGDRDTLLVSSEVLIKPIDGIDTNELDNIISSLNITNVEKNEVYWTLYLPLELNVVEVANYIQEQGLTEFSYPNSYIQIEQASIPSDPYFEKQFYLRNTGQSINGTSGTLGADIKIIDAWDITKGSPNIKIAVCDEGITSDHPDLPNSRQIRLNGSNIAKGWWSEPNSKNSNGGLIIDPLLPSWSDPNDPSPNLYLNNNHGNACAGIIAATHNSEGIAGIAPNCKIVPVKLCFSALNVANLSENVIANALGFAGYYSDIISNSWGTSLGAGTFFSTPSTPTIKTKLEYAALNGRNGRGNVIVFCTHNDGSNPRAEASLNIKGLIAVGASDMKDNKPAFSNFGVPLDVVAPSGNDLIKTSSFSFNDYANVWTIDIPDEPGNNPWHVIRAKDAPYVGTYLPNSGTNYESYTGHFGGTSASAPQVSGVAALILSVNPCLTSPEVETIIKRNADKVGGFNYNWSSAAPGHSKEFGYGRLNALRALVDLNFEQNKNYTSNYKVKAGSLHAGYSVTNQITNGNVVVKTGKNVEYLATGGITLDVGFEVESNSTFSALVKAFDISNCYNWDQIPMTLLDQQSLIANAQFVMKPKNNNENNISLKNLNTKAKSSENFNIESTNKINFYPNPNIDNSLNVSFEKQIKNNAEILIFNSFGEVILKQVIFKESKVANVDLSKYASGIYTIVVSYDGEVISKRIVKL